MKGMQGGMAQLLRQANQMQSKMKKVQEELAAQTYEGTSGGGAVKVTVNGDHFLKNINVSAEVLKSGDNEMIHDMIIAAANEAIKIAKETSAKEMEKVTGGMNIPGIF